MSQIGTDHNPNIISNLAFIAASDAQVPNELQRKPNQHPSFGSKQNQEAEKLPPGVRKDISLETSTALPIARIKQW